MKRGGPSCFYNIWVENVGVYVLLQNIFVIANYKKIRKMNEEKKSTYEFYYGAIVNLR